MVGVLGTGYQAPTQLEAVSRVLKVKVIKAFSRTSERRKRFAQDVSRSLDIEIIPVESSHEVVEGSDVVVCITNSLEPVLEANGLHRVHCW